MLPNLVVTINNKSHQARRAAMAPPPPGQIIGNRAAPSHNELFPQGARIQRTGTIREETIGTFMDAVPAIIILQPIVGAVGAAVGIDPYHMGIVVVLTLAIGLITPPYGLCILIASDIARISVPAAMRALVPFYVISLSVVTLRRCFPTSCCGSRAW